MPPAERFERSERAADTVLTVVRLPPGSVRDALRLLIGLAGRAALGGIDIDPYRTVYAVFDMQRRIVLVESVAFRYG